MYFPDPLREKNTHSPLPDVLLAKDLHQDYLS
jgi:hypothetical protein